MYHLSLEVFGTQSRFWLNQENTSKILCHGFSSSGGWWLLPGFRDQVWGGHFPSDTSNLNLQTELEPKKQIHRMEAVMRPFLGVVSTVLPENSKSHSVPYTTLHFHHK